MSAALRMVACPRCATTTRFTPENPWRPFCSERCKLIDLGKWASEEYRVPDPSGTDAERPASPGPESN